MPVNRVISEEMSLAGAPISFAFKKTCKTAAVPLETHKCKESDAAPKVFISNFGAVEGEALREREERIIPKQENSFRPGGSNGRAPKFIPKTGVSFREEVLTGERFEAAKEVRSNEVVQYGLQKRSEMPHDSNASEFISGETAEKDSADAFRAEVQALPDEADAEAYEKMPVEEFGLAMLRGMDWKEGQVLGRNKDRKPVEAIEYVPRASRLGLGAAPDAITSSKKKRGPVMVLPVGADGKVRHVRTLDEKLVPLDEAGVTVGCKRKILAGDHKGFLCTIMQAPKDAESEALVQLPNEEEVHVQLRDLGDPNDTAPDEDNGAPKSKKQRPNPPLSNEGRESWLMTGIRVRVVDKRLEKGKYYLKKGTVVDVLAPSLANLVLDKSQSLKENVQESSLETVIPRKEGSTVMIVKGEMRGTKAQLLQRRSETGMAAVQVLSDMTVHHLSFDDIAEYARP